MPVVRCVTHVQSYTIWLRISEISGILKTFDEDAEEWVYRIFFKDGEFTDLCDNEDALELVRLFEQEE